ncbi:hypothetical protein Ga0100231_000585 [Opitutaceae bacterium TAV4]|nr:hypothetical protein Ga0100231_001725 [Opitutaceae bacterium TAV4]RRK01347.1 hypothetical protein Ga0100231_000585 [Opitutaceae bacterium TAV4]RRK01618.1 hypothetical protein Ga0100230_007185 [Opitutaceae bacterium TAV3]
MSLKERLEQRRVESSEEPAIRSLLKLEQKSTFLRVEKTDGRCHWAAWVGLVGMDYEPETGNGDAGKCERLYLVFTNSEVVVHGLNLGKIARQIDEGQRDMALRELPTKFLPLALARHGIPVITSIEVKKRFNAPVPTKQESPMNGRNIAPRMP